MDKKYFDYKEENGVIAITHYKGSIAEVHIPQKIDGKTVRIIGECAFYNCLSVTDVYLPDTIRKIEESAFEGCINLETINFYREKIHMDQLRTVNEWNTIPSGIQEIPKKAFKDCVKLKNINLPVTIMNIREQAFSRCINLNVLWLAEKVEQAESLINIAENAFDFCPNLCFTKITPNFRNIANISSSHSEPEDGVYEATILPIDERIERLNTFYERIQKLKADNKILEEIIDIMQSKEEKDQIEKQIKANKEEIEKILSYHKM